MYYVLDSTNEIVRAFCTFSEANNFKVINNRMDWIIKNKKLK